MSEDFPTFAEQGEDNIRSRYGLIPDLRRTKPPSPKEPEPEKTIILLCPVCKSRKEVPLSHWEIGIPCTTKGCGGKMIYHKDVVIKHV